MLLSQGLCIGIHAELMGKNDPESCIREHTKTHAVRDVITQASRVTCKFNLSKWTWFRVHTRDKKPLYSHLSVIAVISVIHLQVLASSGQRQYVNCPGMHSLLHTDDPQPEGVISLYANAPGWWLMCLSLHCVVGKGKAVSLVQGYSIYPETLLLWLIKIMFKYTFEFELAYFIWLV